MRSYRQYSRSHALRGNARLAALRPAGKPKAACSLRVRHGPQSGQTCVPTQSVGTRNAGLCFGLLLVLFLVPLSAQAGFVQIFRGRVEGKVVPSAERSPAGRRQGDSLGRGYLCASRLPGEASGPLAANPSEERRVLDGRDRRIGRQQAGSSLRPVRRQEDRLRPGGGAGISGRACPPALASRRRSIGMKGEPVPGKLLAIKAGQGR